ncbi:MAG TPA: HAMP domain-containing sensor histidine kinase [Puia sp.]|nr:HAMP domain-containing sensor histidine kinase [Puia sp.]
MKLIAKYNRINTIATIIVLLTASVCYYFIVRYVLIHQLDNTLRVEEVEIMNFVQHNNKLPEATNYRDQHTNFTGVDQPFKRVFSNTGPVENNEKKHTTYRMLSFPVFINGKWYKASVTKSEEEMQSLVQLIVLITIGIIVLLLLILFITNRLLLRKLWEPFYVILESIKAFNFSDKKKIVSQQTNIEEFKELNMAVSSMQSRIIKDYETLKNFVDNASHEMQTPLAILNSRLDLFLQEPGLQELHTKQLQLMYSAMARLTNLNKSLLLLAKIDNNQFKRNSPVQIDVLIKEKLSQLEDLINAKHLTINTALSSATVQMDGYLADILLNNLINNAIKHNVANGSMHIYLDRQNLTISNTGVALDFDPSQIFDRFKKRDESEGVGLGLAIAKQICDNHGFEISYSFANCIHVFEILFLA